MRFTIFLLLLLVLVSCQVGGQAAPLPTVIPFPTMTPGRFVSGDLSPAQFVPQDGGALSNPATAIALSSRATPTPDASNCPAGQSVDLRRQPASQPEIVEELLRYLSAGGSIEVLEEEIRDTWDVLGEDGYVRTNTDLTGEGTPEVVIGYLTPEDRGALVILGCQDGRYVLHEEAFSSEPIVPELIWLGDLNQNARSDVLFAIQECDSNDTCVYQTRLLTWDGQLGRFVNLIEGAIISDTLPVINDTDDDKVTEIIIQLQSRGTTATGPLRTGLLIYDWNGQLYTLSIVQYDPPRYHVQIVHEGDKAFNRLDAATAAQLYEVSLNDASLRYWFNDGPVTLRSYTLYRLMLAYAFLQDGRLFAVIEQFETEFPRLSPEGQTLEIPVYAEMAYSFWNALQATSNLHSACLAVQEIMSRRPEALTLMNRYGSRSPTYTELDLCPY